MLKIVEGGEPVDVPINEGEIPYITNENPDIDKYLMNIVGTSIQAGKGKLVTCGHVVEAIVDQKARG